MAWRHSIQIRPAVSDDVPSILWLIQLLAECENEPNALKIGEKELMRDGFGEEKFFHIFIAELKDASSVPKVPPPSDLSSSKMMKNGRLVGYTLYFFNYSTWDGRVLYIEDVFVREEYRNLGLGTALMKECAKVAKLRDCKRVVWQVLDWNTKALDLYERLGGKYLKEWLTIRMDKDGLESFIGSTEDELFTA